MYNKARLKILIVEGYIGDEYLTFCSKYLDKANVRFNRRETNFDGIKEQNVSLSFFFSQNEKPLSKENTK